MKFVARIRARCLKRASWYAFAAGLSFGSRTNSTPSWSSGEVTVNHLYFPAVISAFFTKPRTSARAMLKAKGDWMPLGSADEQKPAEEGTVEAWGRSPKNPVG